MSNSKFSLSTSSVDPTSVSSEVKYPSLWTDGVCESSDVGQLSFQGGRDTHVLRGSRSDLDAAAENIILHKAVGSGLQAEDRDFGLWLLRGSLARFQGWTRVEAASRRCSDQEKLIRLKRWPNVVKRCCDIVASFFLLIGCLPLFAILAILIKIDSIGPVFFRHLRVGKDGKSFMLWKFRSMKVNVSSYELSPTSAVDMRLTRLGRLIRRLSLDELPQLINVFRGEMSFVGPRPEMPFIVGRYGSLERERLKVKPGITGLWQISPARAFPIHDNLQYDLHYIQHQNLVLDCAIILRTVSAIIRGVGAI
jgi:lipopolysaccharide/colanic/teichoic acid biosynthesis glycosyltransferase